MRDYMLYKLVFPGWLSFSLQHPVTLSSPYQTPCIVSHSALNYIPLLHIVASGSRHYCKLDHCTTPLYSALKWFYEL